MKRRTGKILGLAIGQRSILLAEVNGKAGAWSVLHVGEFVYPEGMGLENPAELGAALRTYLKSQKFSTRDAIIGLPAKRLVTRRKDVPPAPPAAAASTLRLQAESEFSAEADTLVMDFAGDTSTSEPTSVLLVAATRECITECETLAKTAGLKLHAVTATGAALARATSRVPGGNGVVVNLAPGNSELIVQHGDSPAQLRHLNMGDITSGDSLGLLAGEIRRSVAALPRNGSPLTLAIWDANPQERGSTKSLLEQRLNMPVAAPQLSTIVTSDPGGQYAPAVAVGLIALEADRLPIDFLDSRLAPPPAPTNNRLITWSIIIGVLLLGAIIYCWNDVSSQQSRINQEKAEYKKIADKVEAAKTAKAHRDTVRQWNPSTPRMVACLRDLTAVFPEQGSIYATKVNLAPQPDGTIKGSLSGKSSSEQDILTLRDHIHASKAFTQVANPDTRRDTSRGSEEFTFSVNFTYRPPTE